MLKWSSVPAVLAEQHVKRFADEHYDGSSKE